MRWWKNSLCNRHLIGIVDFNYLSCDTHKKWNENCRLKKKLIIKSDTLDDASDTSHDISLSSDDDD